MKQQAEYASGQKMQCHFAPRREVMLDRVAARQWPRETAKCVGNCIATMLAMALLAITAVGCGSNAGTVVGKVTFQGEPITIGTIAFIGPTGKVTSGNIQDGTYTVADVEPGLATVTVTSHEPSPMMHPPSGPKPGEPAPPPLKYVPIPERYSNAKRSGLTYTVRPGKQTHDVVLQP